jgi:hypothetical protein
MELKEIKNLIVSRCLSIDENGSFDINIEFTGGVICATGTKYEYYENNGYQRFDDEQHGVLVSREVLFSGIVVSYDDEREKHFSCAELVELQDRMKV